MPSLQRPNAPERLPSQLIERLQSFGGIDFSEPPGSKPPASPGLVSPRTVAPRSISRQDRRRLQSESSEASPKSSLRAHSVAVPTFLESIAPALIREIPSLSAQQPPAESSLSESNSTRSSIGSRAKKFFDAPHSSEASKDGLPPRKARKGFAWHHQASDHWLEVKVGRTGNSSDRSQKGLEISEEPIPALAPPIPIHNPLRSVPEGPWSSTDPKKSPVKIAFQVPANLPASRKEGLFSRTKRRLGLKRDQVQSSAASTPSIKSRTKTGELLDRTASMLRLVATQQRTPPAASTSRSSLSSPTIKAPNWQMQLIQSRTLRGESASSSVRSFLMGKPPVPSPEEQVTYTGSDNKQYFQVSLTSPGAPTFLPSEARRINTPPLHNSKVRGFFFDYTAAMDAETFPSRAPPRTKTNLSETHTIDHHEGQEKGQGPRRMSDTGWYRVKLDAIEAESLTREQFATQVPDHLPTSPLCPRHPKHRSAGTGVCPMHGRNRASTSTTGEKTVGASTPSVAAAAAAGTPSFWIEGQTRPCVY